MLLTGLRGVGKTVLLNEIERLAKENNGYRTISIEAHEDKALGPLIAPHLKTLLYGLDRIAGAGDKVKRGLAVLRSFIGASKSPRATSRLDWTSTRKKAPPTAAIWRSICPTYSLPWAKRPKNAPSAVAVLIDEIQYFNRKELGALIMALHKVQQRRLPLVLLGAGLPILPGLAGESKSYAERLFSFPDVGALSEEDAAKALRDPAQAFGVAFEPAALQEVFRLTNGYPYFLQEWGYQAWNLAAASPITLQVVQNATAIVIPRLEKNFFRVRFDRLTPSEKNFLRAMAELGAGPHRTGDIASTLGVKIASLGPVRARLIKKGMVYSPSHGDIAFTVPLFDEFMVRAIREFHP